MINKIHCLIILIFFNISLWVSSSSSNPNEINTKLAGVSVTIYKTDSPPSGITFFLTGALIPLSEYRSTIDVLLDEKKQLVIGYYINVLWPPVKNNHQIKAYQVETVFDAFREKYPEITQHLKKNNNYNIVGHSVGGQISLIVASEFDAERRVSTIIALDPVDENPSYFTNESRKRKKDGGNDTLRGSRAKIVMTLTDGGAGISTEHNAAAIHEKNVGDTTVVRHEGAGHMAYTDHGGGVFGLVDKGGTPEGNKAARDGAQNLIRKLIKA